MIRVAAVGDIHLGTDSRGQLRPHVEHLAEHADVLLLAGDLTRRGQRAEVEVLVEELRDAPVPIVAVLGNHDYESGLEDEVAQRLQDAGVTVLEGSATVIEVGGARLGVAGTIGFGGGFPGRTAADFGEPEMKAFVGRTRRLANGLERALGQLDCDVAVALLHYAPVEQTLVGEPPEIHAFLGSYLLAEAIDRGGAHLAIHGHAHHGVERGVTPGGVPVRNVAQPVLGATYRVYALDDRRLSEPAAAAR